MFDLFYNPLYSCLTPKIRPKGSNVQHHETCPVCGRLLVNLYLRNGEWKCKQCWDALEGGGSDG